MASGNNIRNWIFPVAVSLLLHLPLLLLLAVLQPRKPITEPNLTVVLRTAPPARQITALITSPSAANKPVKPLPQKKEAGKAGPASVRAAVKPTKPAEKPDSYQEILPVGGSGAADETTRSSESAQAAGAPGTASRQPDNGAQAALIDLDTLQVTQKVIPDYPAFSRKRKEEGRVKIIAAVKNGAVVKAEIIETSGFKRLDGSALRAVKQWRFHQKHEMMVIIPFVFSLTD